MANTTQSDQAPPTGLAGFFQPTPQQPPTVFEPPGYDLLRQMLIQKIFGLQGNPYNFTGAAAQNPTAPGSSGMGSAPMFSTGLNMNTPFFQGGFGGGSSGGVQNQLTNPAFMSQPQQAAPAQAMPGIHTDGRRVPISALQRHFNGITTYSGPKQVPTPLANPADVPQMGKGRAPAPTGGAGGGNPLLAGLAQQNQENAGNGANRAWNSTAANNPWAGMNQSQFQSAMGNNVGGGGIFGLNRLAGPNWMNQGRLSLPGMNYTGGQHEWGGNPMIGAAASRAGWSPQQTATWTLQGMLNQNPTWGSYLSGAGNTAPPIQGENFYWHGGPQPPVANDSNMAPNPLGAVGPNGPVGGVNG